MCPFWSRESGRLLLRLSRVFRKKQIKVFEGFDLDSESDTIKKCDSSCVTRAVLRPLNNERKSCTKFRTHGNPDIELGRHHKSISLTIKLKNNPITILQGFLFLIVTRIGFQNTNERISHKLFYSNLHQIRTTSLHHVFSSVR